ncbi:competence protein CoiA [Oikeobacillus pervagus]|uniref:competence protein CoiA n=1 Tax=Oikeobacillus pervagus TaxID=1325931 RepID=UPI003F9659F2
MALYKSREELYELRKLNHFFCPQCQSPLLFKIGQKRIPHFSHRHTNDCHSFSEHESPRHLQGKLDLFNWLKNQQMAVQLEAYLPTLQQRPDLFLPDQSIAIEFQCSTIPENLFCKRTSVYQQHQLFPFWIFGGNVQNNQHGLFKLSKFQQLFLQHSSVFDYWLPTYCPDQRAFTFLLHIIPISTTLFSARKLTIPLEKLSFPLTIPKLKSTVSITLKDWMKLKKDWIQKRMYYSHRQRNKFLNDVYNSKRNPFLLHPYIGLPVKGMIFLNLHPLEWQFYLWNEIFNHLSIGAEVSIEKCVECLRNVMRIHGVRWSEFPLTPTLSIRQLVHEYFKLLEELEVLFYNREGKYIIRQHIEDAENMMEALKKETKMIQQYERFVWNKRI